MSYKLTTERTELLEKNESREEDSQIENESNINYDEQRVENPLDILLSQKMILGTSIIIDQPISEDNELDVNMSCQEFTIYLCEHKDVLEMIFLKLRYENHQCIILNCLGNGQFQFDQMNECHFTEATKMYFLENNLRVSL